MKTFSMLENFRCTNLCVDFTQWFVHFLHLWCVSFHVVRPLKGEYAKESIHWRPKWRETRSKDEGEEKKPQKLRQFWSIFHLSPKCSVGLFSVRSNCLLSMSMFGVDNTSATESRRKKTRRTRGGGGGERKSALNVVIENGGKITKHAHTSNMRRRDMVCMHRDRQKIALKNQLDKIHLSEWLLEWSSNTAGNQPAHTHEHHTYDGVWR